MINLKKLFRNIKIDLNKSIFSFGFAICIIVTFLLCFTSVIYTDGRTGREYSVFQIIIDMQKFRHISLDAESVFRASVSHYLTIFLPVLSALPYVTFFCSERVSGCIRMSISRSGKLPYYTAKFISAAISGGFAVMMGYILYGFVIYNIFPSNSASLIGFLKLSFGMLLYGAISVLPAFFLSAFIKNKYIICCLPFIIMHFYYTMLSRIQDKFISTNNWNAVMKMSFLYPNSIREIFETSNNRLLVLCFYVCLAVISFIGFTIIMNRRFDYGE